MPYNGRAELRSFNRDFMAHKAGNIYHLVFYQKKFANHCQSQFYIIFLLLKFPMHPPALSPLSFRKSAIHMKIYSSHHHKLISIPLYFPFLHSRLKEEVFFLQKAHHTFCALNLVFSLFRPSLSITPSSLDLDYWKNVIEVKEEREDFCLFPRHKTNLRKIYRYLYFLVSFRVPSDSRIL